MNRRAIPATTITHPEPELVQLRMTGFGIGSATIEPEHRRALIANVVPVLASGGSIAIVGHTSRSGSETFNEALSRQRANAVLEFCRSQLNGRAVTHRLEVKSVSGEGERAAAESGAADGSEDAFYRAVTVAVWSRPVPPVIRMPERRAPQMVPRIVSYSEANYSTGSSGAASGPGEEAAQIGTLIHDWYFGPNLVKDVQRRPFPADHVVTEIRVDVDYNYSSDGISNITTEKTTNTFTWGPHTPTVTFISRSRVTHTQSGRELYPDDWKVRKRADIPREQLKESLQKLGSQ